MCAFKINFIGNIVIELHVKLKGIVLNVNGSKAAEYVCQFNIANI